MVDAIKLPKTSLKTFSGNPLDYWIFIKAFDSTVGQSTVEDADKLNRLLEYCTGKAEKVISPCAIMDPSKGYKEARKLLKRRFGDDHVISNAWIKKIVEGPVLKPNKADELQDLADDVQCCLETLNAMNKLAEVESQDRTVRISKRLPICLQTRWRKVACTTVDNTGYYPDFKKFTEFLNRVAREANDPIYGKVEIPTKDSKFSQSKQKKSLSLAAEASADFKNDARKKTRKCFTCDGDHFTSECEKFKKMKPSVRLETVKRHKLCFNCVNYDNHFVKDCRKRGGCSVAGCNRRHSELLHEAVVSAHQKQANDEKKTKEEAKSMTCLAPEKIRYALPIVPVKVRGKGQSEYIHTFAMLDTGCNRTFCSTSLLDKLGVSGEAVAMDVDTIAQRGSTKVIKVSLEATGTFGKQKRRKLVQMPNVYAIENFIKLKDSVIIKEDVNDIQHLKDIPVPSKASEVS